jgi:hypothetical protein
MLASAAASTRYSVSFGPIWSSKTAPIVGDRAPAIKAGLRDDRRARVARSARKGGPWCAPVTSRGSHLGPGSPYQSITPSASECPIVS